MDDDKATSWNSTLYFNIDNMTGLQASIANSEWLLDVLQQHHDLEKAQCDWQQQAWAQLNSNTGYYASMLTFNLSAGIPEASTKS